MTTRAIENAAHSPAAEPEHRVRLRLQRGVIVCGSYGLLLLALLIACGQQGFRESFFSADDLYLPTLFEDLVRWSGNLDYWRLTPAPFYFPDMPLYLGARALSRNVEWSQYLSGIGQFTLFVAALSALVGALHHRSSQPKLLVIPAMAMLAIYHCDGGVPLLSPLFHLTQHGGATLMTIVVVRFALVPGRVGLEWAIVPGLCALCSLVGFSDPLFVGSCCAALFIVGSLATVPACWRFLVGSGNHSRTVIRNRALASAFGGFIGAGSQDNIQTRLQRFFSDAHAGDARSSLTTIFADLSGAALPMTLWLALGLALCCVILLAFRSVEDRSLRAYALWQSAAVVLTIPAIASYGTYDGVGALRYFTVPYASTLVVVFAVLVRVLGRRLSAVSLERAVGLGAALTLVCVVATATVLASRVGAVHYKSHWRGEARCVQSLLESEQTDLVLTDYWHAKPLMLFSDQRVKALQMRPKLRNVYHWINSAGWYRGPHRFGVIGVNGLEPEVIRRMYGEPARIEHCDDLELFVYRDQAATRLSRDMARPFARFTRH